MKIASSNIYTSNFRRCYSAAVSRRVRSVVARALLTRLPDKYRVRVFVTRDTGIAALERRDERFFCPLSVFTLQFARILIDFAIRNADIFDELSRGYRDRYGVINR